jgi:hypothetical protein
MGAGHRIADRDSNFFCSRAYRRPVVGGERKDGNLPPGYFLLMLDILVAGKKQVEFTFFGCGKQVAILEFLPAHLGRAGDRMRREVTSKSARNILIEQYSQETRFID